MSSCGVVVACSIGEGVSQDIESSWSCTVISWGKGSGVRSARTSEVRKCATHNSDIRIAKLAEASLRVKVMVAVWPDFKAEADEVMVMVGETVSTWIVN